MQGRGVLGIRFPCTEGLLAAAEGAFFSLFFFRDRNDVGNNRDIDDCRSSRGKKKEKRNTGCRHDVHETSTKTSIKKKHYMDGDRRRHLGHMHFVLVLNGELDSVTAQSRAKSTKTPEPTPAE